MTPNSGTADSTVDSFLASLNDGSLAADVPADDRPVETLGDQDGNPLPDVPQRAEVPNNDTSDGPVTTVEKPVFSRSVHANRVKDAVQPEIPQGVVPGAPTKRDLSMFPAEAHGHLRQMSNSAFEWVRQQYAAQQELTKQQAEYKKQLDEAQGARDQWLFSHEKAYMLSPEYEQHTTTLNRFAQEENYWTNALAALDEGQPIRKLLFDPQTQQLSVDETDIQPSPQVRAAVVAKLTKASQYKVMAEQRMQQWQGGHNQKLQEFRARLDNIPQQLFPNGIPKELQPLVDKTMQSFPAELRGQKEYQILAQANALIGGLTARVQELEAQVKNQAVVRQTVKSQGPGEGRPAVASNTDRASVETPDDYFKRVMGQL